MEEIVLGVKVNTGDGKRTVADLRNEMQTLTKEVENTQRGTDAYAKAIQRLGETKAELKDLKEDIAALDPDAKAKAFIGLGQTMVAGFTAAQGAAALFGSENEDIQKGILKMQAAIGVLHGIQAAADAADQVARLKIIGLKQLELLETKKGIVATEGATVAQRLWNLALSANPIGLVVTALVTLTAAIGTYILLTKKSTEAQKANNATMDEGNKIRDGLKKSIDETNIKLKEETGEITKQQGERLRAKAQYEEKFLEIGMAFAEKASKHGADIEAETKKRDELRLKAKEEYNIKLKEIDVRYKNEEKEKEKKHNEELLKLQKQKDEKAAEQRHNDVMRVLRDAQKAHDEQVAQQKLFDGLLLSEDKIRQAQEEEAAKNKDSFSFDKLKESWDKRKEQNKKSSEEEIANEIAIRDAKLSIAQETLNGLVALSGLFEKNGKKNQKLQKSLAIAQIAIDTASGISTTIANAEKAAAAGGPSAPFLAISYTVSGIARVLAGMAKAKAILGTSEGGVSSSAPTSGGGSVQAPRVQTSQDNLTTTRLGQEQNSAQKPMEVRVSVLESDITNTQNRVKVIQDRATF